VVNKRGCAGSPKTKLSFFCGSLKHYYSYHIGMRVRVVNKATHEQMTYYSMRDCLKDKRMTISKLKYCYEIYRLDMYSNWIPY